MLTILSTIGRSPLKKIIELEEHLIVQYFICCTLGRPLGNIQMVISPGPEDN